jgi:hypothetical protein
MSDLKARLAGYVCDVQFVNHMDDGTTIIGVTADFTYADGSTDALNNPNLSVKYNESTDLYSANKCVKKSSVAVATKRPDGTIEVKEGRDPDEPAGKCRIRSVWVIAPAPSIDEAKLHTGGPLPIDLMRRD